MTWKSLVLWLLFLSTVIVSLTLNLQGDLFSRGNLQINQSNFLILTIPVLLLVLHSFWTLSTKRGLVFILLATITGFIFEYYGLKYGTVFGGEYIYLSGGPTLLTVPLNVILFWGVFIYTGYCVTNSFLYWLSRGKPSIKAGSFFLVPPLIVLDGLIVVAIDLFMDPLQVMAGTWAWPNGGPFFGIPIGNFVGWFLVTIISTGIFRLFEYFYPISIKKSFQKVFIIPVLGYGLLYLNFLSSAIKSNMLGLALVGTLTMLPIFLTSTLLFLKQKQ